MKDTYRISNEIWEAGQARLSATSLKSPDPLLVKPEALPSNGDWFLISTAMRYLDDGTLQFYYMITDVLDDELIDGAKSIEFFLVPNAKEVFEIKK